MEDKGGGDGDATPKVMLALKAEGVVGEFALAVVGFGAPPPGDMRRDAPTLEQPYLQPQCRAWFSRG